MAAMPRAIEGPVAQLEEFGISNPKVAGSIPAWTCALFYIKESFL